MKRLKSLESNYKKQLIGVGAFVGLLAIILITFAVMRFISASTRPTGNESGSVLARQMERSFPKISILGVSESESEVEILLYDPSPLGAEWSAREGKQMDKAMLIAMRYSVDRNMDLALYALINVPVVGLDGQPRDSLYAISVFFCPISLTGEINWSTADHDVVENACVLMEARYFWGNAEKVTWPVVSPERSR